MLAKCYARPSELQGSTTTFPCQTVPHFTRPRHAHGELEPGAARPSKHGGLTTITGSPDRQHTPV